MNHPTGSNSPASVQSAPTNSLEVRQRLVEALHLDLIGPGAGHDLASERLPGWVRPSNWYLTGFLIPAGAPPMQSADADEDDDLDEMPQSAGLAEESTEERKAAKKAFFPSSMGLSFLVPGDTATASVTVRWAGYGLVPVEDAEGKPATVWQREQKERTEQVSLTRADGYPVADSGGLSLHTEVRRIDTADIAGIPAGARSVSVFLVNRRKPDEDNPDLAYAFQAEIEVQGEHGFAPRPDLRGAQAGDWDDQLADLPLRGHARIRHRSRGVGGLGHREWRLPATPDGLDPERQRREDRHGGILHGRAFDGEPWGTRRRYGCRVRATATGRGVPHLDCRATLRDGSARGRATGHGGREAEPARYGEWPFEIGLWVGKAATPNVMGHKGESRSDSARAKTRQFKSNPRGKPSPIPLESCPWCGSRFEPDSFTLLPNDERPKELRIVCANFECDFSGDRPLPILAVDEPIYRRLPAFLIATADKFASLPWAAETGKLLGGATRFDGTGFHGSWERGGGKRLEEPLLPPDRIIQDELHLISGPLGTMVGLCEASIEALCIREMDGRKVRPKIVASTATVRQAQHQIQALFARGMTQIFPPPGPDRRDSFFAQTTPVERCAGRLYLGITSPGRNPKVLMRRVWLALMGAAERAYRDAGGHRNHSNPADPYMTVLGYFNSLRELGGARRILEEEVQNTIKQYGSRRRVGERRGLFQDRRTFSEVVELTSRVSTNQVADARRRLERPFHEARRSRRCSTTRHRRHSPGSSRASTTTSTAYGRANDSLHRTRLKWQDQPRSRSLDQREMSRIAKRSGSDGGNTQRRDPVSIPLSLAWSGCW